MTLRVLVAEDEAPMRRGIVILLQAKGFEVLEAATGPEAYLKASQGRPDLVVLDVMLPGQTGFEVLQALRAAGHATPVIMLTARGTETDKVMGFALGVDDYVTKPFSTLELLGRIEAVLRRCKPAPVAPAPLHVGLAEIDFARLTLRRAGEPYDVPARALDVLAVLARAAGRVVPRDALVDEVWGAEDGVSPRSLDNVMVKLRQAIEPEPDKPRHLVTVRGRGYRLDP